MSLRCNAVAACLFASLSFGSAAAAEDAVVAADAAPAVAVEAAATATSEATTLPTPAPAERDERFQELFGQWQAMDTGKPALSSSAQSPQMRYEQVMTQTEAAPAPATVSIPSRMPVTSARLSSGYGMRTHPVLGKRRKHNGIDLAAPTGTPVYATADGEVSRANRFGSYGLYISIEHGAELQTRYAHLSRIAVRSGERVRKGDLIGYVGSTGRSTGPHLHYEVRVNGKSVNPLPYMAQSEIQRVHTGAKGGR